MQSVRIVATGASPQAAEAKMWVVMGIATKVSDDADESGYAKILHDTTMSFFPPERELLARRYADGLRNVGWVNVHVRLTGMNTIDRAMPDDAIDVTKNLVGPWKGGATVKKEGTATAVPTYDGSTDYRHYTANTA